MSESSLKMGDMSQLTVGTVYGPVRVVDAADHFTDTLKHLIPARTHLRAGIVLTTKSRYASLRSQGSPTAGTGPDERTQTSQIWVTSTTHPDYPGNTYGTTWLLLTCRDLPPVAIAFTVLAGHPKKRTPALAQTPTQFELIHDLLPGTRSWLLGIHPERSQCPVPWDVLARIHPVAVAAARKGAPKSRPAPPLTGLPPSMTSPLTWASVGVLNPHTLKGFAKLNTTPGGCLRSGVDMVNPDIALSYYEAAYRKLAPILEARSKGKPGRGGRPTWKLWMAQALDLATSWADLEVQPVLARPEWGERMYTQAGEPIPVEYARETAAYGWTAEEAARFWIVHKMVCPKCPDRATPALTPAHKDTDLQLMGWAPMKVTGRDASRYMLAGFNPDDVRAWPWNGQPAPETLAVSASLRGFDIALWDQVAAGK